MTNLVAGVYPTHLLWLSPLRCEVARRAPLADRQRHGEVSTTRSGGYGRIAE